MSNAARMDADRSSTATQGDTSEIITKGEQEVVVKNWKEYQLCIRPSRLEFEVY